MKIKPSILTAITLACIGCGQNSNSSESDYCAADSKRSLWEDFIHLKDTVRFDESVASLKESLKNEEGECKKKIQSYIDSSDFYRKKILAEFKRKLTDEDIKECTKGLRVKHDKFDNRYRIEDLTTPQYVNYNGFFAGISIAEDKEPFLFVSLQYAADDWLFIKSCDFNIDGNKEQFYFDEDDVKKDNESGRIFEWITVPGYNQVDFLKRIANGKEVMYRLHGSDYKDDFTVTPQQKKAILNVLNAYDQLIAKQQVFKHRL